MRRSERGVGLYRARVGVALVALMFTVGGGSLARADRPTTGAVGSGLYRYELHMAFFSRETHQPRVIDPQMFAAARGVPAGTGPQTIPHAAGVAPVLAEAPTSTRLLSASGQPLGVTLGRWEAARGDATLVCHAGLSTLVSRFAHLLPFSAYSLFIVHLAVTGPRRFTPLGDPGGRGNNFVTGATGTWTETSEVAPCLTSGEAVVLVWHSDGRAHGSSLGRPGVTAHNHLIFPVMAAEKAM